MDLGCTFDDDRQPDRIAPREPGTAYGLLRCGSSWLHVGGALGCWRKSRRSADVGFGRRDVPDHLRRHEPGGFLGDPLGES